MPHDLPVLEIHEDAVEGPQVVLAPRVQDHRVVDAVLPARLVDVAVQTEHRLALFEQLPEGRTPDVLRHDGSRAGDDLQVRRELRKVVVRPCRFAGLLILTA